MTVSMSMVFVLPDKSAEAIAKAWGVKLPEKGTVELRFVFGEKETRLEVVQNLLTTDTAAREVKPRTNVFEARSK